jgi:hypothetical protein
MAGFSKRKALFLFILSCFLLLFFNSESVQLTARDKEYLLRFQHDWHLNPSEAVVHKDFNSELNFISTVHDSIIAEIKHEEIPHTYFGDVSYYYNNRKGVCYDRSVLMEKMLSYYHFSFRHIYVYFGKGDQKPGVFAFFNKGLPSHALTEVKTSRGWMLLGSNSNWIGIDSSGHPLTLALFRNQLQSKQLKLVKKSLTGLPPFWTSQHNFRFIYGVYSRHGGLFSHQNGSIAAASMRPAFHVLPDYNIRMLLYNFFN